MQPKDCACLNIRKTSRQISQAYDAALQPTGLRNTQFSLLSVLVNNGPLPVSKLASKLAMDRTTLTRNIGVMTRSGLVGVHAGEDPRTRHVHLTDQGRQTFETALPHWKKVQESFLAHFGKNRWDRLLLDLAAARQSLE